MPDIKHLGEQRRPAPPTPPVATGRVVQAPANADDPTLVILPAFSGDHVFQAVMPRSIELPEEGATALVTFAENGEPWLLAWR